MPVADPEGQGMNVCAALVDFGRVPLKVVAEKSDGAFITAVKAEVPSRGLEILQGDGRIGLQHRGAFGQNKLPDGGKARSIHQVRGGLGKGGQRAEFFQKRDEMLVSFKRVVAQGE